LDLTLVGAQPTDESGTVLFAALETPYVPGDPDTFKIKGELRLQNHGPTDLDVLEYTLSFPGTSIPHYASVPSKPALIVAGGDPRRVIFEYDLTVDLSVPLPARMDISLEFKNETETYNLRFPLAFYRNDPPVGSHIFPMSVDDLQPGESWVYRGRHIEDPQKFASSGRNVYAYDVAVVQWHNGEYVELGVRDGELLPENFNTSYLAFGDRIFASAEGHVVQCVNGNPDNVPPGPNVTGKANELVIQYGDEAIHYVHLMENSIPFDLCPFDDGERHDVESMNLEVSAGQVIGRVGNSGDDVAHLHFSVHFRPDRTVPFDSDLQTGSGFPLNFHNIRIASDPVHINNLGQNPAFKAVHGRIPPSHSLIIPNLCALDFPEPGFNEFSRHGVDEECYQDFFNLDVTQGYRPVFTDGYEVDGNTFFNSTFGAPRSEWVARAGLDGQQYQDLYDELDGSGWHLQQVDSYLSFGAVRYAAIFELRSGPAQAAFHGLNDEEYADVLVDLTNNGFVPVNISAVHVGGQFNWTGLFEQVPATGWTIETVPVSDFQGVVDNNFAAGRKMTYVHGVATSGGPFLTGIFVAPIGGDTADEHDLTASGYQAAFDANLAAGRFTRYTTGFDDGSGNTRFAAVWRARPSGTITQAPQAQTSATTATFHFTADNPFASFECRLDQALLFSTCSSPKSYAALPEGEHTFRVIAVDRDGIRETSSTSAAHMWVIDNTAPSNEIVMPPPSSKTVFGELKPDEPVETTTIVGWGDIVADLSDNLTGVASVEFRVNGVAVPAMNVDPDTWKIRFTPDQRGEHLYLIEVLSTDGAGNLSDSSIEVLGIKTGRP